MAQIWNRQAAHQHIEQPTTHLGSVSFVDAIIIFYQYLYSSCPFSRANIDGGGVLINEDYWRGQEELTILKSRLLLRKHRMDVASFVKMSMKGVHFLSKMVNG